MSQHTEQTFVPFTPTQMFDLVLDIEKYPLFLPWCLGARVTDRQEASKVTADLVVGFKALRERFTSHVTFDRPGKIDVAYGGGPLAHLENRWRFQSAPGGCRIDFYVDFRLKSRLLGRLMDAFFDHAFNRMVEAFEKRAEQLYGPK